ncbi:Transthyretin-like family protein [Brugia pahangi]
MEVLVIFMLFLSLINGFFLFGKQQQITVQGEIGCENNVHTLDVHIELWEKDAVIFISYYLIICERIILHSISLFDDKLNSTQPQHDGFFEISGTEREWGSIETYLIIRHHCYQGKVNTRCIVTDRFAIPSTSINKVYNMGIISLNIHQNNRKTICRKL